MVAKTYDRQTAKFLAVIGENMPELSGDVMQGWIQNPKAVQQVLSNAFCPPEAAIPRFNTWKTIKLGTGNFLKAALRDNNGFNISFNWPDDILGKPAFTVATEETEVDLVKVTVAELGFEEGARYSQIYERIKELGLKLCPSEVGPQLRLQYQNQPDGEWVLIGMEPITDPDGYLSVFCVEHRVSGLWLGSVWLSPAYVWYPDNQWVFVRPRK